MASHDDWRAYESQIVRRLKSRVDGRTILTKDRQVRGRLSDVERQIDIWVEGRFAGRLLHRALTMAVDCKCWSSKVDVTDIEAFIGLVQDVGADLGLLVTTEGFSKAAVRRAERARGIDIEVIKFDDLEDWTTNPLLGRASLRLAALKAYDGRCAFTGNRESALHQIAHIQPLSQGGALSLSNALVLRADIHLAFDRGLLTIGPAGEIRVAHSVPKTSELQTLAGNRTLLPIRVEDRPGDAELAWHRAHLFLE